MPPLAHAAGKGSCSAIVALLEGGARLESAASLPLTSAATARVHPSRRRRGAGELAAVELLLKRGADPNRPPGAGIRTPAVLRRHRSSRRRRGQPRRGRGARARSMRRGPQRQQGDAQSPYSPRWHRPPAPARVAVGASSSRAAAPTWSTWCEVTVGDSCDERSRGPDRKCRSPRERAAYCNELDAVRFLLLQGAIRREIVARGDVARVRGRASGDARARRAPRPRARARARVGRRVRDGCFSRWRAFTKRNAERSRAGRRESMLGAQTAAANAEAEAVRKKAEEELKSLEDAAAEAERLAAKVRKQEEYKKEQEARKKEAAAKRAEAKEKKAAAKAAAEGGCRREGGSSRKCWMRCRRWWRIWKSNAKRRRRSAPKEKAERDAVVEDERRREKGEKSPRSRRARAARTRERRTPRRFAARPLPSAKLRARKSDPIPRKTLHQVAKPVVTALCPPPPPPRRVAARATSRGLSPGRRARARKEDAADFTGVCVNFFAVPVQPSTRSTRAR